MCCMNYISRILILVAFTSIYGCKADDSNFNSMNKSYYRPAKKLQFRNSSGKKIEEYINRVGKRLLIVAPAEHNFIFAVKKDKIPNVIVANDIITVTTSLLKELKNEAELATILAYSIIKNDNQALQTIAFAGYDPTAAIELQERLLVLQDSHNKAWQNGYFRLNPQSATRIQLNRNIVAKLPKGLHRGTTLHQKTMYY